MSIPENIKRIFGPVTELNAQYKVDSIATHFKDTTNVYIPKTPLDKLQPGMQLIQDAKTVRRFEKQAKDNEENLSRSLRRSLQRCKHIIRCNDFDWFATFTFAKDRDDVEKCRRQMETYLENIKKRYGHFDYVIVSEYHQDGAIHFHAVIKNFTAKITPAISKKTGRQIRKKGRLVYDIPSYTLGHVFVNKCDKADEDKHKLEYYLNKLEQYLNKEQAPLNGKKRFWYTRGLKRPIREDNPSWYDDTVEPKWSHENEWGTTKIFSREQVEQMREAPKKLQ